MWGGALFYTAGALNAKDLHKTQLVVVVVVGGGGGGGGAVPCCWLSQNWRQREFAL